MDNNIEIGDYICLSSDNVECTPYKVLDITDKKIAAQKCKVIDEEKKIIQVVKDEEIILLSYDKKNKLWKWSDWDKELRVAVIYKKGV